MSFANYRVCRDLILAFACAAALTACGGNNAAAPKQTVDSQARKASRVEKTAAAADYETVVQGLYIAYFGRPADQGGLANIEAILQAANAPTDIVAFATSYSSNPDLVATVNSFGYSGESEALYSSKGFNSTTFVQAVFQDVLGRPPLQAGLAYWSNAIDSGALTPGSAAVAIMVGA